MLVISRRIGESFLLGDNMEVTIVDITGEKVVLGVAAPKTVPISRLGAESSPSGGINEKGYARKQKEKHGRSGEEK